MAFNKNNLSFTENVHRNNNNNKKKYKGNNFEFGVIKGGKRYIF